MICDPDLAVAESLMDYFFRVVDQKQMDVRVAAARHKVQLLAAKYCKSSIYAGMFRDTVYRQEWQREKTKDAVFRLADVANQAGFNFKVIKGLSFERCLYGDLHLRDAGDVDVLIKSHDAVLAHECLRRIGYRQRLSFSSVGNTKLRTSALAAALLSDECYEGNKVNNKPIKKHPYKDEFSAYVKEGEATIEVHTGFGGLSQSFLDGLVDGVSSDCPLIDDDLATLIILLLSAHQNSESFFSNTFDFGIVLRDYIDLAVLLKKNSRLLQDDVFNQLISNEPVLEKTRVVFKNLSQLMEECEYGDLLDRVWGLGRESVYQSPFICRLWSSDIAYRDGKTALVQAIKSKMTPFIQQESLKYSRLDHLAPGEIKFGLIRNTNSIEVEWLIPSEFLNENHLFQTRLFSLNCTSDIFYSQIDLSVDNGSVRAFFRNANRYFAGATRKVKTKDELEVAIINRDQYKCVSIRIDQELLSHLLSEVEINVPVFTADVYKRHCESLFWNVSDPVNVLLGDVPIGRIGYCSGAETVAEALINGRAISLLFDDIDLMKKILSVFSFFSDGWSFAAQSYSYDRIEVKTRIDGYECYYREHFIGRAKSQSEVCYLVTQQIIDIVSWNYDADTFVAHACANSINDTLLLIMGKSGSGKTSLSIALSKYMSFVGDECVFIKPMSGVAFCEPLPFLIKKINDDLNSELCQNKRLSVVGGDHGPAFYYSREQLNVDSNPRTKRKIKWIVFPHYDAECQQEIDEIDPFELVSMALTSLSGAQERPVVLKHFLRMVSQYEIRLIKMEYSNADEAAAELFNLVKEGQCFSN